LIFLPDPRVTCPCGWRSLRKATVVEIVYERIAAIDVGQKEVAVTPGFRGHAARQLHPTRGDRRDPGADRPRKTA
jgi:hypothetical protein